MKKRSFGGSSAVTLMSSCSIVSMPEQTLGRELVDDGLVSGFFSSPLLKCDVKAVSVSSSSTVQ